jgi:hypothetical protein
MRRLRTWISGAAAICLGVATGLPAGATVIATNTVVVATADGAIEVVSTVEDEYFGDASRWRFSYAVSGDYDPFAPDTNGISSLQIVFAGPVLDVTAQSGPTGWELNSTSVGPPFGAGWDLPNSAGAGIGANDDPLVFDFAVPAGTPYTFLYAGSYAGSHYFDVPFGLLNLETLTSEGPIVPVPEPASIALLGGGLALLARRRLTSAA